MFEEPSCEAVGEILAWPEYGVALLSSPRLVVLLCMVIVTPSVWEEMALLEYRVTLSNLSLLLLRMPVGINEEPTSCVFVDTVSLAIRLWTGLNVSEPDTWDS